MPATKPDTPGTAVPDVEDDTLDTPVAANRWAGVPTVSGPPIPVVALDDMTTYKLDVLLHSYIGHPYWPERERVINITKMSGMSRARSDANRRKALETWLKENGMTFADWEGLQEIADRPFYTDSTGQIVIPELHVISMIVAACDSARAAQRPISPDQVRSAITVSPWATGKKEPDKVWERFAVVTAGTGQKLSNQRALRVNPFIEATACTGTVMLNQALVSPDKFRKLLDYAGTDIGIGASRKMGFGRFTIRSMSPVKK